MNWDAYGDDTSLPATAERISLSSGERAGVRAGVTTNRSFANLEPVLSVGGTGDQPVCGGNLPPKHPAGW